MTHASHGAVGIANGSGWMTSQEFIKYMNYFIKHTGANGSFTNTLVVRQPPITFVYRSH